MKKKLSLQTLRRSGREKELKIYHKAIKIIQNGGVRENLSDNEIIELAKKYPTLSIRMSYGDNIFVTSRRDSWYIKNEGKYIVLYHKGWSTSGKDKAVIKEKYHVQDVFSNMEYVLASIQRHDEFSLGTSECLGHESIDELIESNC